MKKPKTPQQMKATRKAWQAELLACLNALHDADFRSLLVDSTQIGMDDYYNRVIVDEKELGSERFDKLVAVCKKHGWKLSLNNDYDHGIRLAVWTHHG